MQKFTTTKQLIDYLNTNNSPILATVTVKTEQKMNKKDVATKKIPNPHGPIFKISQMQLTLNADYEQLVNFQRTDEGKTADFESQAKKAAYNNINRTISEKDGVLYVNAVLQDSTTLGYVDVNNDSVEYNSFAAFVPASSSNKSQGLENAVQYRTIKLENVVHIQCPDFSYVKA